VKRHFKRYWWVLTLLVILFFLPKIIDALFNVYLCDFTAMNNINSSDMLEYVGSIIGGVCALAAILVAIKHFSTDKKPIIIPRNKRFFLYLNYCGRIAFLEDPNLEDDLAVVIDNAPLLITLENVTENAAIAFDLKLDYKNGEYYKTVCNLIGGEPSDKLKSNFDRDVFPKQGVFNSKSIKTLPMPTNFEFIVKGICYKLSEPKVDINELAFRYNHFIRKSYKVAEMTMTTKDISGKSNVSTFDLELTISHLLFLKADYEILLTFVIQE